jgi:predicted nucleotidyltransferase component of viral defense system
MIALIKEAQSDSLFKDHVLAGGTALALQLGHRTSTDIDLFTPNPQNTAGIVNYFKNKYTKTEVEFANKDFIRIRANDIKVEMVQYEEKIIENPGDEEGIRFFTINEIAAMKLRAITHRTESRDFIDLAYLLKEMSLKKMFDLYKEKHGSISPLYMKRTLLIKSRTIKENEWLVGGIKMLKHDIELNNVPKIIENAINEYNLSLNIGIQDNEQ